MKLNNKGMAISGILYSILVLFLVLLFGILALLASGKYTFDKLKSDIISKLSGDVAETEESPGDYTLYPNGTAIYYNPETGHICSAANAVSTTETKTGCMKWYIFNDSSSSSTVNMILDHNTTAQVAWNSTGNNTSGPSDILTQLQTDTSTWTEVPTRSDSYSVSNGTAVYTINYSSYKARLISAAEIAEITKNYDFAEEISPSTSWFNLDSNNKTQIATTTGASNYDWLFDYTNGCTSYGCNIADDSNYGYWTSTAASGLNNGVWLVHRSDHLEFNYVNNSVNFGVRPVITLNKSVLISEVCDASLYVNFAYTGASQTFNVLCDGTYKLETWGAQGGSSNATYYGGYGAYSTGEVDLSKNDELYVVIGGAGTPISGLSTGLGGYNGGGARTSSWTTSATATQIYGTGGGATHIALSSGLLSELSSKISDILIVSAGGGGSTYMYHPSVAYWYSNGGAGGGISGGKYTVISATATYQTYLTQNTMSTQTVSGTITYNGTTRNNGSFGVGGSSITGGGGGFYGGTSHVVGNGGSSYIGNALLTNKSMYCYSCTESSVESTKTISTSNSSATPTSNYAKQGSGYAKITYLGE